MDPWNFSSEHSSELLSLGAGGPGHCLSFENSFQPHQRHQEQGEPVSGQGSVLFEKLPDSDEYLARLESRLQRLQSGRSKKAKSSVVSKQQDLVTDLSTAKEDALCRLIRSESQQLRGIDNGDDDSFLEEEVSTNVLYRRLVPEQPLTRGEKVILVAADQLAKAVNPDEGGQDTNVDANSDIQGQ